MKIIDLHCDTIMHFWMGKKLSEMQDAHINLAKLKAGNVGLQCFAIFVPTGSAAERLEGYTTPEAYFDLAYERFLEETEANSDEISQVFTVRDLEENLKQNRISAMLTVEDGVLLDGVEMPELDGVSLLEHPARIAITMQRHRTTAKAFFIMFLLFLLVVYRALVSVR